MSEPSRSRQPGPPRNPALRDLIAAKRHWSSTLKSEHRRLGFRGWHERGYLPHRDESGLVQFLTFRLVDSFPDKLRSEWEHLWRIEDDRQRRLQLEAYLDRGRGACQLRQSPIAQTVQEVMRYSHGRRYDLRAWVVMPNHVHALIKVSTTPMSRILEGWKKRSAFVANRTLHRCGQFWQADYWDTFMRDSDHELRARHYIETNPTRAKLVVDPRDWPWSSARFRDDFGVLRL